MIRPEKWHFLPSPIISHILDNCELTYDSYESSRAEIIDQAKNGHYDDMQWHPNYISAQRYYEAMTNEEIARICQVIINDNLLEIENLKNFIIVHY